MSFSDRRLRASWSERSAASNAPDSRCPDAARIWQAVQLELSAKDRRSLVDHVADCALCAETWRIAAGLAAPVPSQTVGVLRRSLLLRWAVAAASIVAVAGVAWLVVPRAPSRQPALRTIDQVIQSQLKEGDVLPRSGFVLQWTSGPPGTIYDIDVGTTDLRLLSRATALTEPEYVVPEAAFVDLEPGTPIAWRVTATLPDGRIVTSVTSFNAVR